MPERGPYDEAMLLSQARLRVPDADLKHGKVETITIHTVAGSMQRPWGVQGGFAVVYKFCTQSGKMRALRCFVVQMTPDTQYRYERIGSYFAANARDITVEFKYYDTGIAVKELVAGQMQNKTYPVIEMEWIEGITLVDYVDHLCVKRNRAGLDDVIQQWVEIVTRLRRANISHGDLAGVNVMVRPNGRLVLVDYDGVYIPDFAGLPQIVLGQADYQHPQMHLRSFDERADDFSAQVIYTALVALRAQPALWDKYTRHNTQGTPLDVNILFKQQDFVDPDRSVLFAELERINDTQVSQEVRKLKQACRLPITQAAITLLNPQAEALVKLEQAIQSDDDEEIVNAWIPTLLENYAPAQQYLARVALARQTVQALKQFHTALQTCSLRQIVSAYDPAFTKCRSFTLEQANLLLVAMEFAQAYQSDDDQVIAACWEAIESSPFKPSLNLTAQEQQRVALAQQRKPALVKFRLALMNKNVQQVVDNYNAALLDASASVTPQERELLQVGREFVQAYRSDDDQGIVAASEAIQNFAYRTNFAFTAQEQQRIELARQRKLALVKFRLGLMSKNARRIVSSYDWILDDCANVTTQERDILRLAKDVVLAYHLNDEKAIAGALDAIQKAHYQQFFVFSTQEQQRLNIIQRRNAALTKFRLALVNCRVQQIVDDYAAVLDDDKAVTAEERAVLQMARNFAQACQNDDEQAIVAACEEIQDTRHSHSFIFTEKEQQRISLARQCKAALIKLRLAMMQKSIQQIVAAYDPILNGCSNVTGEEHKQIRLASAFVQALQSDNDQAIFSAWSSIQTSPYQKSFIFTAQESQRIAQAYTSNMKAGGLPHA